MTTESSSSPTPVMGEEPESSPAISPIASPEREEEPEPSAPISISSPERDQEEQESAAPISISSPEREEEQEPSAPTSISSSRTPLPPLPPPPGPRCVILGRVALVDFDILDTNPMVKVKLATPPQASIVTVPMTLHPDHYSSDFYPYVLAAADAGLLLHVSFHPFIGFNLGMAPPGIFLVACDFAPASAIGHHDPRPGEFMATTAVRVPDRNLANQPCVSTLRSVGLVSRPGSGGADYVVAELSIADGQDDRATLYRFRSGTDFWDERELICNFMPGGRLVRAFHDVIAHNGELWWADLASGLLGCDPFADDPVLRHVAFQYTYPAAVVPPDGMIETRRMVRVSQGKLRFVELACPSVEREEETLVVIWTLVSSGWRNFSWWEHHRVASLASIWDHDDRYLDFGLPEEVPQLALLHPNDPDLVYFFLRQNLFSVNVHECMIKEFVPLGGSLIQEITGGIAPPICWRYVLAWELPPSLQNVDIPGEKDKASSKGIASSSGTSKADDFPGTNDPMET